MGPLTIDEIVTRLVERYPDGRSGGPHTRSALTSPSRNPEVQTVSMKEQFPGELETLRADNVRLRRLLKLSEEQARAADPDQATLTGAPESPVHMGSTPDDKVRFYLDLFRCSF